jgi:hypothetical protein
MIQISYDPFLGGLAPAVKIPKVYGAEKKGSSDAILEREGRTIRRPSRDCEFDCPFSLICLCPQGIRPSFARGCSDWFRYCSRAVFSSSLKLIPCSKAYRCAQVVGVAFVVKQDVARDPAYAGLLGAVGIVLQAQGIAHLIQKSSGCWLWFHRRFLSFDRLGSRSILQALKPRRTICKKSTSWHIARNISVNATSKRELGAFRPRCQEHAGRRIPCTQ